LGPRESTKRDTAEAGDFFLEEYRQIVAAFFDLSRQKSDMFRFYLVLVTIPTSLIAAIFSFEKAQVSILDLPILVNLVLFAVAIAGLIMTAIVVDIRFECILYAKTVNLIRRFFLDASRNQNLSDYLVLPDGDDVPTFYEQPWEFKERKWKWQLGVGATFLEVLLMGLLNATYLALSLANMSLALLSRDQSLWLGYSTWGAFFIMHALGYRYFAKKKDQCWKPKKVSQMSQNRNAP